MSNKVARGTLLGIAGQGWHLLTAFVLYAYLARRLGPALFGDWRVVLSVLTWFEIFVTSGLVKITSKAVSESSEDRPRLERAAYRSQMLVALSIFVVVQVAAGPIATLLSNPELTNLIRIAALDIPFYGLFMVASAIVLGLHRFERQALSWFLYATAKAAFIAGLVALGFSVEGALVGNALSSIVGLAVVFLPRLGGKQRTPDLAALMRTLLLAAVPFLTLSLLEGLEQSVDLWTVSGVVTNSVLVGLYASASVIAEIPTFLFLGLNRVILPVVARAHNVGDPVLTGDYATQAVRLATIVTVLAVAIAASAGRQVLELVYSKPYVGAFVPLVLLMLAAMGRTVRSTCTELLMALNRARPALIVLVGTVLLEIALLAILTPRYGLLGAGSAAALSALVAGLWAGLLLKEEVGRRPLATLARCVVAAVVVAVALVMLAPSPLALFLALPAAVVVYLLLLGALREFTSDDVSSLMTAIGRRG